MGLTKTRTTYDLTVSKPLSRLLNAADSGLYGAKLYTGGNEPGDKLTSRLAHVLGQIPGVSVEIHTYYDCAIDVTIDAEHDTPATHRAIRQAVNTLENAIRNITCTRYTIAGLGDRDDAHPDETAGPFFLYDTEAQESFGMLMEDKTEARMVAILHNLDGMQIFA